MYNQPTFESIRTVPNQFLPDLDLATHKKQVQDDVDDTYLIKACLAGDEFAWEELLAKYGRLIYTIPLRFDLPRHMADEIYQETCLILLKKMHTIQDRTCLQSWLVTVTKRLCLQYLQSPVSPASLDDLLQSAIADDNCEEQMLIAVEHEIVREAMAALEPQCNQLLRELFFEDSPRSYADIAQKFKMPLGSVGPTRARCLAKLKEEIAKLEAAVVHQQ